MMRLAESTSLLGGRPECDLGGADEGKPGSLTSAAADRRLLPSRLGLLDRLLLRLKFGLELPFGFKPVTAIVTMITTTRDVDFKSAIGNL